MARPRHPLALRLAFAAAVCAWSGAALGEPTAQDLAAARQTFTEGKELEKAGRYADALERFKRVAEVRVTPQVRFHIALCEENLGKLVSAIKGFELAAEDARQAGSSAIEVYENAPSRAEALKKRVAHLRIDVTGRITTSKLTLDDVPVPSNTFGVDQMVDPGKHVLLLTSAANEPLFEKDLDLAERALEIVKIDSKDAVAPAGPPPTTAPVAPASGSSRWPAYVIGGTGIAALGVAGVLMGISQADANQVQSHGTCRTVGTTIHCPETERSVGHEGKNFYTASLITGGIGSGLAATGIVLFFVLGPSKAAPARTERARSAAPWIGVAPTPTGVVASGAF